MDNQRGYSFVELLIVSAMLLILASVAMPLATVTAQRQREAELRIAQTEVQPGSENYPPDLETLVDGVPMQNDQTGVKLKFLRRIPTDPMTKTTEWGLRAYGDKPDARSWGRGSVFDVHSKSSGTALDGSLYKDW